MNFITWKHFGLCFKAVEERWWLRPQYPYIQINLGRSNLAASLSRVCSLFHHSTNKPSVRSSVAGVDVIPVAGVFSMVVGSDGWSKVISSWRDDGMVGVVSSIFLGLLPAILPLASYLVFDLSASSYRRTYGPMPNKKLHYNYDYIVGKSALYIKSWILLINGHFSWFLNSYISLILFYLKT